MKELFENKDNDRDAWIEVATARGVDGTLDDLGFPKELSAIYYNINTGSESSLENLLKYCCIGLVKEEDKSYHLAIELENWLPRIGDINPVMARCIALNEDEVKEQVANHLKAYADRNDTSEEFCYDIHTMGGTLKDGGYDCRKGKIKVTLHDDREFSFNQADIYKFLKYPSTLSLFGQSINN